MKVTQGLSANDYLQNIKQETKSDSFDFSELLKSGDKAENSFSEAVSVCSAEKAASSEKADIAESEVNAESEVTFENDSEYMEEDEKKKLTEDAMTQSLMMGLFSIYQETEEPQIVTNRVSTDVTASPQAVSEGQTQPLEELLKGINSDSSEDSLLNRNMDTVSDQETLSSRPIEELLKEINSDSSANLNKESVSDQETLSSRPIEELLKENSIGEKKGQDIPSELTNQKKIRAQGGPKGEASNDTNGPGGNPGVQNSADTTGLQGSLKTETSGSDDFQMTVISSEDVLPDDVANAVVNAMPLSRGNITILLEPENLGKISVNISYSEGTADVIIKCDTQKTLDILSQNAARMGSIIERNTGQATVVYVPQASETENESFESNGSGENAREEKRRQTEQSSQNEDFLQQLRLGLI